MNFVHYHPCRLITSSDWQFFKLTGIFTTVVKMIQLQNNIKINWQKVQAAVEAPGAP